jgi:hypothetical protein
MKKFFYSIIFCVIAVPVNAQIDLPRVSPNASISQTIGYTNISISYCRPAVRERKIWDGLVPFNQVWRTGANEATTIQFTTDATVQGFKIPAGRYSLFTIPTENEWAVILNKTDKQWGAFNYKQDEDLVRFKVKPESGNFIERLQFYFDNITESSLTIVLRWEKIKVTFNVEVDVTSHAYIKIKDAIAQKPDRWQNYTEGANYAAENNAYMDEALKWTEKAISFGPNYYPHFIKAKVLFKLNKFKDALGALDKCREVGRTDKNWDSFVSQADYLEKQIKQALK